jgi:aldehyde dehydrogenase (NAD+)
MYNHALAKVVAEGGKIIVEGGVLSGEGYESGCYVKPAIAEANNSFEIVQHEPLHQFYTYLKYRYCRGCIGHSKRSCTRFIIGYYD